MSNQTERSLGGGAAASATTERCRTRVYGGSVLGYPCNKPAKHEHKGTWYCGIHYPPRVLAKRQETDRKWAEKAAASHAERKAKQDAQEALERDAARYRWLRGIGREQVNVMAHYAGQSLDAEIDKAMSEAVCAEPAPEAPEPDDKEGT